MRSQIDSYSMLICSKYVKSIEDMNNITLVNSKFKETVDKLHFNPFQIDEKTRKYFSHLQTQWLFYEEDEIFSDGDISGYYVYYEVSYHNYLEMKTKYQNIDFRRIIYTIDDRKNYGDEIPFVVHKLDKEIFSNSDIEEINIPDSVVEIGDYCFQGCYCLNTIFIPTSITRIGNSCFSYCNITSIIIPSNVIHFGSYAFSINEELKEVKLPNNMMELSDCMFSNCFNLTKINIPSSITKIGDLSFYNCYKLTIPTTIISQLHHIGSYCFSNRGLRGITLSNQLTYIGKNAFSNNRIESLIIPSSLCHIGTSAFDNSLQLTHIEIPDSVTCICENCFFGCSNLRELNIPMSVVEIGNNAFKGCCLLESINGNVDVCIKYKNNFQNTAFFKQLDSSY